MRTEPPVSVPSARSASPRATTTADPLEEPPGTRAGASGLTGVPVCSLTPSANQHSSLRLVLPTIRPPELRIAATHGASAAATPESSRLRAPTVVTVPTTSIASFTATVGPSPAGGSSRSSQAGPCFTGRSRGEEPALAQDRHDLADVDLAGEPDVLGEAALHQLDPGRAELQRSQRAEGEGGGLGLRRQR